MSDYITDAAALGLCIVAVLNTGARICTSHRAPVKYDRVSARDGQRIRVGSLEIELLCGSGYRSSIAASLLRASGFSRVQNIMGGMAADQETTCPDFQPAELVFSPVI